MVTLGIEYLTGYAVATDAADRDRPEWPPHPARVFMAMAAAFFETGEDPAEKDALLWLEKLAEHPRIYASDSDERSLVTHFVPVNDELNAAGSTLPMLRRRQARGFPRVRPHDPRVFMTWENAQVDPARLSVINSLCGKVTRIGHSSSLVRMWATENCEPDPALAGWIPNEDDLMEQQFRVVSNGAMDELVAMARYGDQQEFDRIAEETHAAKGPAKAKLKQQLSERFSDLRPQPLRPVFRITAGYGRERNGGPPPARSVWDSRLLVFGLERIESSYRRLDIRATLAVARALRDAAMSLAGQRGEAIDEALSGHKSDGSPSESPHCAFFALPFVGRQHADGRLVGVAIAFPRTMSEAQRRRISATIGTIPELLPSSDLGKWKLIPPADAGDIHNLRPRTWCEEPGGATEWATVTPIVFDDHPKSKGKGEYLDEVAEMIRRACERVVGSAAAVSVVPSHVSRFAGTPTAREFPRLRRKDGSERRHLHATITFDRPVVGPILLGAGRYRGYGLLRPI